MRALLTRVLDRIAPVDETAPPSRLDHADGVGREANASLDRWDTGRDRCQTGCGEVWTVDRHGWRTCGDCSLVTGGRVL